MENVFLIAAGGTGGHFYPGLALGKKLIEQGYDVVFVVKKSGAASKILDDMDMFYQEIDFCAPPRNKNPKDWLIFTIKFLKTMHRTYKIIREYKPKACVGMGGYISFPLIFAAHLMGVKTAVHDSNAKIGLANRICAKFTDLFLLGLPVQSAPKNAVLVGTPVREEFRLKESVEEQNYWRFATDFGINVMIFGGSQGARNLNFAAAHMVKSITEKTSRMHFVHITGSRDYEEIQTLYKDVSNVKVLPYSHDIHALMKAVQLIIGRSGASSLAEIISLKKPSILVPFPHAADDHQYCNAKVLSDRGCAKIILESPNLKEDLENAIKKIMNTPQALKQMQTNFDNSQLPDPLDSASYCVRLLEKLAKNH